MKEDKDTSSSEQDAGPQEQEMIPHPPLLIQPIASTSDAAVALTLAELQGGPPAPPSTSFCTWTSTFISDYSQFWERGGKLVDVCLLVLVEEWKSIYGHRDILAAASPYFRALFEYKENLDKGQHHHQGIWIGEKMDCFVMSSDFNFQDLNTVIDYVYQTEVTMPRERLRGFISTAKKLRIEGFNQARFHIYDTNARVNKGPPPAEAAVVEGSNDNDDDDEVVIVAEFINIVRRPPPPPPTTPAAAVAIALAAVIEAANALANANGIPPPPLVPAPIPAAANALANVNVVPRPVPIPAAANALANVNVVPRPVPIPAAAAGKDNSNSTSQASPTPAPAQASTSTASAPFLTPMVPPKPRSAGARTIHYGNQVLPRPPQTTTTTAVAAAVAAVIEAANALANTNGVPPTPAPIPASANAPTNVNVVPSSPPAPIPTAAVADVNAIANVNVISPPSPIIPPIGEKEVQQDQSPPSSLDENVGAGLISVVPLAALAEKDDSEDGNEGSSPPRDKNNSNSTSQALTTPPPAQASTSSAPFPFLIPMVPSKPRSAGARKILYGNHTPPPPPPTTITTSTPARRGRQPGLHCQAVTLANGQSVVQYGTPEQLSVNNQQQQEERNNAGDGNRNGPFQAALNACMRDYPTPPLAPGPGLQYSSGGGGGMLMALNSFINKQKKAYEDANKHQQHQHSSRGMRMVMMANRNNNVAASHPHASVPAPSTPPMGNTLTLNYLLNTDTTINGTSIFGNQKRKATATGQKKERRQAPKRKKLPASAAGESSTFDADNGPADEDPKFWDKIPLTKKRSKQDKTIDMVARGGGGPPHALQFDEAHLPTGPIPIATKKPKKKKAIADPTKKEEEDATKKKTAKTPNQTPKKKTQKQKQTQTHNSPIMLVPTKYRTLLPRPPLTPDVVEPSPSRLHSTATFSFYGGGN